ncbi:O-antigen ligase family protein [Hyphomonas pacifica]|uniref:O-antigen ligase-related domain-containing protein n=1 Tax=Hyphomonas pacifica TaxID=1280941 RepID=A0A8B2PTN3_9PROT|nr:O-antigen ligase family protein [Hyphomonas pacifica]RAN32214.1 hypothetical protein HY3_15250 [Hyphomonas pacifica]RAN35953.1 hypothetical protein HY11_12720 [Hyphomonas pacifica]
MNIAVPLTGGKDTDIVWANAYEEPDEAPLWEQGLVTMWFLNTFVPLPLETPLRYLLMLFFMVQLVRYKEVIFPIVLKSWPLFLLPIFGLMSVVWAPSFSAALRTGVLFLLTPLVIVIIISRMQISTVLRCLFLAGALAVVVCVPYFSTMSQGGPYPQKNFFALQMLFVSLLSLATLLNDKALRWTRLLAAGVFPIALFFMLQAPSATALVFAIVGIAGLLSVKFLWVTVSKIRHLRSLVFLIAGALVMCGLIYILNQPSENYMADFLAAVGKDATFTGRTHIWQAGELAAKQHPWFGTGMEGFWQIWNGAAQSINENDFKPYGTKLTFHNAYLEVRVHLGYIGMSLYILLWAWCWYRLLKQWLLDSSVYTSALLVFGAIVFVSTFTESYAWSTFNTPLNLLYVGAVGGFTPIKRKFIGKVPVFVKS